MRVAVERPPVRLGVDLVRHAVKIVLWGINYAPEATGIAPFNTELAEFLAGQGHSVSVVTGFAYYPQWRKSAEDARVLFRTERMRGVEVHRCWQYVPGVVTTLRRMVHELSFGLMSLARVLALPRADIYVIVSPPLVLGFFAWIATRLKGSRYIFHVQDLQPDAAVGLGMVRGGLLIRGLYALERFAYCHAAAVSGISQGMIDAFTAKNVAGPKQILFPNWLRGAAVPLTQRGGFRAQHGLGNDDFLAVYSGNLGRKQGIEILVAAAQRLHDAERQNPSKRPVRIFIVGAGAGRDALETQIAKLKLPNLELLPLLSDAEYAAMLADADVGLITQAAGTGQFFFPSKLLSLLRAGVPVVTVADTESELARAVAEGGFGLNVLPGQPETLAAALQRASAEPQLLEQLRANVTWVERFSPEHVLPRFARQLARLVPGEPRPEFPELAADGREPYRS